MNLFTSIESLRKYSYKTAIILPNGESITYGQFERRLYQTVRLLKSRGVTHGTKVLLWIPVNIDLYIYLSAIFHIGAIAIFIDPWAKRDYIGHCLRIVQPDILITLPRAKILMLIIAELRQIQHIWMIDNLNKAASTLDTSTISCTPVEDSHTALVTFTTGSTGTPKGADRTHGFLLAQQRAHERYFRHDPNDIDLVVFPIFVLSNLTTGMTSVIIDGDLRKIDAINAQRVIDQIHREEITSLSCPPSLLEKIITHAIFHNIKIRHIQSIFVGGAPVYPKLFDKCQQIFPHAKIFLAYGSTEAEPMAMLDGRELLQLTQTQNNKAGGIALGRVVEELEFAIIEMVPGPVSQITPLSHGTIGEIVVTGPFVGQGYINNPQAFKENKIVDSRGRCWHRTGDVGYFAPQSGLLYMVGRMNAKIVSHQRPGEIFFPLQVEPLMNQIPGVQRSSYFQLSRTRQLTGLAVTLLHAVDNPIFRRLVEMHIHNITQENGHTIDRIIYTENIPLDSRHRSKIDYQKVLEMLSDEKIEQLRQKNILVRLLAYTKERFPLPAIALFISLLTFNTYYLGQLALWGHVLVAFNGQLLLGILSQFLILFHIRLLDEFKDYADDCLAHPDRLLSRGVVTLKHLGFVLVVLIGLEAAITLALGSAVFIWWIVVTSYSLLMFKEFFAREFLKRQMTLYLVSHQMILPLMIGMGIFIAASSIETQFSLAQMMAPPTLLNLAAITLFITLLSTAHEIARKTWSADREHEHADSYTKTWGRKTTVLTLGTLYTAETLLAFFLIHRFDLPVFGHLVPFTLFVIALGLLLNFSRNPDFKRSKLVEFGGTIFLIGNHLAFILLALKLFA